MDLSHHSRTFTLNSEHEDAITANQSLEDSPEHHGLQGLRGQPLKHPLQRRVEGVILVPHGAAAALQEARVQARFTQDLLIPLRVHQHLQDVCHC